MTVAGSGCHARCFPVAGARTTAQIGSAGGLGRDARERVIGFHAKDGVRTGEAPGVGRGYDFVPFGSSGADGLPPDTENGIDFSSFYDRVGRADHVSFWEQDDAGGGAAKPMQSLTFAAKSLHRHGRARRTRLLASRTLRGATEIIGSSLTRAGGRRA
jgi:hypothetical protein